ncbi:MAG: hypothetical protein IJU64_03995 [Bacilli bacterium]|nr:hypothetical protein [Bacilli bacterium]
MELPSLRKELIPFSGIFQAVDFQGPSLILVDRAMEDQPRFDGTICPVDEIASLKPGYQTIVCFGIFDGLSKEERDARLSKAISLLGKKGTIYLAAHNRFGLSFLAGLNPGEGPLYEGLEQGLHYSRQELLEEAKTAGLTELRCLYPVPTYRQCITIYSDDHLPQPGEIRNLTAAIGKDRYVMFDEEKAFDHSGTAFPDVANSFLLVGRKTK